MKTALRPWGLLQRHKITGTALIAIVLSLLYWGVIASDRYVSEAHVMIQSTSLTGSQGASGIASMLGGGMGIPTDQLLLRDYMLSIDMLKLLDAKFDLRSHYSNSQHDLLSRLWFKDTDIETFHDYYLRRLSVELDQYAGVLIIQAQAYDPDMAHAIADFLVAEGERYMDILARDLAQEQVDFLSKDIQKTRDNTLRSRELLLDFQNKHGMVSPESTTANIASTINRMETQLTDLQTSRAAMLGYLMPSSANIVELNLQIAALEKQLTSEKAKLTSNAGKTLNSTVEAYQRLEIEAQFAQDAYKATLATLEQVRIEASRTLKKVSVLQTPTVPQDSLEPRRGYNCTIYTLLILILAGIIHLLAAIIRDHRD